MPIIPRHPPLRKKEDRPKAVLFVLCQGIFSLDQSARTPQNFISIWAASARVVTPVGSR